LLINIATVIGPTPPGTGVIYAAFSAALSNSTSPTNFPSTRLIPTSMTTALSLKQGEAAFITANASYEVEGLIEGYAVIAKLP